MFSPKEHSTFKLATKNGTKRSMRFCFRPCLLKLLTFDEYFPVSGQKKWQLNWLHGVFTSFWNLGSWVREDQSSSAAVRGAKFAQMSLGELELFRLSLCGLESNRDIPPHWSITNSHLVELSACLSFLEKPPNYFWAIIHLERTYKSQQICSVPDGYCSGLPE